MRGPRSGPPPPDASWNFDLPEKLKLGIADAVVTFARMEATLLEIVWILEESTLEEKRELTMDVVSKNFDKLSVPSVRGTTAICRPGEGFARPGITASNRPSTL